MTLTDDDRRAVAAWAAACAGRVLPLFEAHAPGDDRPRAALEGARAYASGGSRTAHLRTLAWAAYAAAREVGDPGAAAARAAGLAAGAAYLHALAHATQAKHVLGPPAYAALACELAAPGDPDASADALRWARVHASPTVRDVLRRFPAYQQGRSRIDRLMQHLDAELRA